MDVTISIPAELAPKLLLAASQKGQDIVAYILQLVVRDITAPSLDEILAPVREQFAASGLTEDELDAIFEEERQAIWEEKQRQTASMTTSITQFF